MEVRGSFVVLRVLEERDITPLLAFARDPSVARWWPRIDSEDLLEQVGKAFAIEHDGALAGYAEVTEELDPDYRHAGIDLFLGAAHQDRGLGRDAVRALARHLIHDRGHHRVVIDPAAANERAIRCYGRVGFRPVGVLRKYERDPDGAWRDGLLMDMLAEEIA